MKKALVFIDFDILIRHFIKSGAFSELDNCYDVTYVFHKDSTTDKQGIFSDVGDLRLKSVQFLEVPRNRMGQWYHLFIPSMLSRHRGTSNYAPALEQMKMSHTPKMARRYWLLSMPGVLQAFRWFMMLRLGTHEPLRELLRREKPDLVIHPSLLAGYFINDLLLQCKSKSIPLILLMNSWDNPSNKAVTTGMPDKLVVWGDQTRKHAMQFLGLPPERIEMFGAAQFELYRSPIEQTHEELCSEFQVPTDLPILLYSGAARSFNETGHLVMIDEAIERGDIPQCHVLYRPHPWRGRLIDGEKSLYDVNLKHVTLDPHMDDFYKGITITPRKSLYMADYAITKKLMHLIDALVSPLSTMMLEATLHGKPVLAMFVDADPDSASSKASDVIRRLVYFADFVNKPGILTCDNLATFAAQVKKLMEASKNPEISLKLKELASTYTIVDGPPYAARLVKLADELTEGKSA